MSILTLDLGTKSGWAIEAASGIYSGNEDWNLTKKQKALKHIGYRFYQFKQLLTELKSKHDISEIYYEKSYFGAKGKIAGEIRNQFVGVLLAFGCHHDIPVVGIPTATLRSSYGNNFKRDAGKEYSKKCASNYYKKEVLSDDESDALMLLRFVHKKGCEGLL